jgi:hypothetical protein
MSLNPFIDPRKHALRISAPIRVHFVIRSESHVVEPIRNYLDSDWRPTVIRAVLHVYEFVRRMVINVRGDRFSVIHRSSALPAVPERIENVIRFVAYERGFYLRNDYYNGINFAFLLNVRAANAAEPAEAIFDFVRARHVRKEVLSICEQWLAE